MSAREKLSNIGWTLAGLGFLTLLLAIIVAFVRGMVWFAGWLQPIATFLAELGTVVLVLNLLPSAIFKGSRRYCGNGIVLVSYVWGISLWCQATLILYQIWGTVGLILGMGLLGVGSVGLLEIALFFRGEFAAFGWILLAIIIIFATRTLGYWVISKGEPGPSLVDVLD